MPFIYIFCFIFALLILMKKQRKFDIGCYLLLIYIICVTCFAVIYYFYSDIIQFPERINIESVFVHLLLLFLFLFPFVNFSKRLNFDSLPISDKGLIYFAWCLIVPSLLAIYVSAFDVVNIIAFGNYDLARTAYLTGDIDGGYITRFGFVGYFFSFGPQTCFLSVTMFFYFYFYKGYSKLGMLLFISSLALVVQNLSIAGREGFVRWMLYFGFNFILFRNYVSYKEHKVFWKIILVGIIVMFVVFRAISIDRFQDSSYGPLFSFLNYAGQPFYHFSYVYEAFGEKNTSGLLSIFSLIVGNETTSGISEVSTDFALNTFSTFVGGFIKRAGFSQTLIFGVFWFLFLSIVFNKKKKNSFTLTIAYITLYDVLLIGVLYFIHYPRFTQITMLFYIFVAYILTKFFPKKIINSPR